MKIQVLYFSVTRELVGLSEEVIELDQPCTVGYFITLLLQRHPRLVMEGVRIAVNEEFQETSLELSGDCVVALIPPVSGG